MLPADKKWSQVGADNRADGRISQTLHLRLKIAETSSRAFASRTMFFRERRTDTLRELLLKVKYHAFIQQEISESTLINTWIAASQIPRVALLSFQNCVEAGATLLPMKIDIL